MQYWWERKTDIQTIKEPVISKKGQKINQRDIKTDNDI